MDEFLGTHTPRLDDKGRLFLPARFRAALAPGLVVTTGQEGCLYVFPTAEFHRISAAHAVGAGLVAAGPRLRPGVPRQRAPRHPRQAGPRDDPRRAARVRAPRQGVHGHRQRNRLEVWDSAAWDAYLAEVMPAYSSYSVPSEEVVPGL